MLIAAKSLAGTVADLLASPEKQKQLAHEFQTEKTKR